jgi:putative transposase
MVLGNPKGSAMPRPYPPEFRRRALDLVESGRTIRDVAASLDIAESCLYRWRHRDLVDRGLKPGTVAAESAELAAARQRIRDLEEEVKILRKAAAAVEAVVPPKERYRLVAELHGDGVRIGRCCHALGVSRSGYYDWAARAPSPRAIRHAWLTDLIGTIHQASRGTYGAPRVHAGLIYGQGVTIGHSGRRGGTPSTHGWGSSPTVPSSLTQNTVIPSRASAGSTGSTSER